MKILLDHIERVKEKPHHVRKQVTFTVAGSITAVIAVVWLGASLSTGAFALKDTSFADVAGGGETLEAAGTGPDAGFAGVGAALPERDDSARIEIVETASSSTKEQVEETTIPF